MVTDCTIVTKTTRRGAGQTEKSAVQAWRGRTSSPSGPSVASVDFSFGAAIPVCVLHLPVRHGFLVTLERLAGCRLHAVNEEKEEESRGVSVCLRTPVGVHREGSPPGSQ